ncbi:MAG: YbaB/EbfC family nucleoid-associated protein [Firmicutes bacterium]|nr:YbaB/EbfC family nucleoid-associated protein [Bacillota bacterium]
MNMQQIMAQAQKMQKDIMAKKDKIDAMDFVGKSEWVEINFKGNRDVQNVNITNEAAFDPDNKEILCDMIMLAIKDGLAKIDKETDSQMGAYSQMGGLF